MKAIISLSTIFILTVMPAYAMNRHPNQFPKDVFLQKYESAIARVPQPILVKYLPLHQNIQAKFTEFLGNNTNKHVNTQRATDLQQLLLSLHNQLKKEQFAQKIYVLDQIEGCAQELETFALMYS